MRIDLHMHTTVSDGTDSPEEIIEEVRKEGLGLFSVTDHDAVKGCRIIADALAAERAKGAGASDPADVITPAPAFIPGVEFSCKDPNGKYHILGYGFDPEAEPINDVVELGHGYRMEKVLARLDFLKERFGFEFPKEELDSLLALDNPGKPHIGLLMVKHGYAKTKNEAIDDFINKLRFRGEYVRPEEAIEGIARAGGIPVLAHPTYGSGDQLIMGEEMEARLTRLMDMGLQGIEAFYSGFTPKITGELLEMAERNELYVTAGSDYHGKNKLVMLGDTGLEDDAGFPPGLTRFLEDVGACS